MTKTGKFLKAIILMAAAMAVIMLSGCSSTEINYIKTVKESNIFSDMPDYSIGQVVDKYVESPSWKETVSDGVHHVTVSGKFKEDEGDFSLTVSATDDPDDKGMVYMEIESVIWNGYETQGGLASADMRLMFCAYNGGCSSISEWLAS